MTDTPHKATPEQWQFITEQAVDCEAEASCLCELRDRIAHLEAMHETKKAAILEIYAKLDKLKDGHESNWSRIVKLEEAQDAPAAAPAPALTGSLVEVVAAVIANGIACDREEERIARDAIYKVAEWLHVRSCWDSARNLREEADR